ncbi:MAG: sulfotransferase [Sphingomonadaceae bacterium]|nr:sulfotransferase [Sphingomonadaceae bacterium]
MASSGTQTDAATALGHAARLLASEPRLAAEQAREILAALPGQPQAMLILGTALRLSGSLGEAVAVLDPLAAAHPKVAGVQLELGLVRAASGDADAAVAALRAATTLKPDLAPAWRALADELMASGDAAAADAAYAQLIRASTTDPRLIAAATALCEDRLAVAERSLRDHLKRAPTDVAAIRMLAEVAARIGRVADAETLLRRALELAPSFEAARHNLATLHYRENRHAEALAELETLLDADPANPGYRNLQAAAFARIGEYGRAIEVYDAVLAAHPRQPKVWMSYGHALKTVARTPESIAAYRRATELAPQFGEAWWSLANLKTFRFTDADLTTMRGQLARGDIGDDDRFHLHFALGKALEDAGAYAESFGHYRDGNALRRAGIDYDADENAAHVARSKALFTREFLSARARQGCADPDPIFIVGLPRAGSTLIEQILASHSQVEGTHELPDIIAIARSLGERGADDESRRYPGTLAGLEPEALQALGRRYLDGTRIQRKTDRRFFIDKMPNNFAHAGLIRLILPNARIIDARRHPIGCCFSAYKQHFARGQNFTYDLTELGRYYADYVELMAHFDAVAPGAVHRIIYEELVADPETHIRRLLDHIGLPFEEGCLRWWETDRAVRTPSSEQVRQPIFTDAADHWRHYEAWLDPLKAALGSVLDCYPTASPD